MIVRVTTLPSDTEVSIAILEGEHAAFQRIAHGAVFHVSNSAFTAPRSVYPCIYNQLYDAGVIVEETAPAARWRAQEAAIVTGLELAAMERARQFDGQLRTRGLALRDYQREGIRWLSSRRSGLLTDEMGLGKTVQALCAIPVEGRAYIVCPASLRGYWRDEVRRWRPDLRPTVIVGALPCPSVGEAFIFSDASLPVDATVTSPVFLVADEAHAYKNDKAQRTKRLASLCTKIRDAGGWTIGLTGTPLLNHPEELYCLARVFGCHRLGWGSLPAFRRAFEVGENNGFGRTYGKPKQEARDGLARISLRRTRAQVLPELPTKSVQYLPITLPRTIRRELDKLHDEHGSELDRWEWHGVMPNFAHYSEVRQQMADLKITAAIEWAEEHEAEGWATVIFSAHRTPVVALGQRAGWAQMTGDTPPEARTLMVREFQAGRLEGIVGTIGAMGVGVTLTRASHVLFIDRMFTPAANSQAEDRVCRLGQTNPVMVTVLVGDHPLEQRIERILQKKLALAQATLV